MAPIDNDALVPIDALVSYAEGLGWKEMETRRKTIRVFVPPKSNGQDTSPVKLVVPASPNFEDSEERLRQAIRLLAGYHDATPTEIVRSIREPLIDVISIRPIWRYGGKGPLSITTMSKLMSQTESFLTHLIARQMEEGASEHVSLIAARKNTAEIAVRLIEPDALELESQLTSPYGTRAPFGRLVTERLAKGLSLLRLAQDSKSAEQLVNRDAPFDREVYQGLQKLLDVDQVLAIRVTITFGSRYPLDEVQRFETVTLGDTVKLLLKECVEKLATPDDEPLQKIEVVGYIADINQKSKDKLFTFSVEQLGFFRPEKYWIQIESKFLPQIVGAKQHSSEVRVEGQLQLKGKRKYIVEVQSWEVLPS